MFFKKDRAKCPNCNSGIEKKFSFCPYCGKTLVNKEKEIRDFGMLGRVDSSEAPQKDSLANFGLTDKLVNSLMNSMMKSLDRQFKEMSSSEIENLENASIEQLPNGIKIKIGAPVQKPAKPKQHKRKEITESQLDRMSKLPRGEAKTKIRRLSDKVVYELAMSGIESPDDIFISKLETGYEIKAIAKNKVYVNTLPISLPMRGFSFDNKKLLVEFKTEK